MKRTSTLEWAVDLNEDKEYRGYVSLHVYPTRIKLYLKDGTAEDSLPTVVDISEKELHQIKYMVDQSLEFIKQSNLHSYCDTED